EVISKGLRTVRQSLIAMCCGKAARNQNAQSLIFNNYSCSSWNYSRTRPGDQTRPALPRALVDANHRSEKTGLGNHAPGSGPRRSNSLKATRAGITFEFRADTVCLSWQTIRESGRLLANDEVSGRCERSAREVF